MKSWYYSKEPHERQVIMVLAIIISLALLYLLIWAPLSEAYARKNSQVDAQRKLLTWMQATSPQIMRLQGSGQAGKNTSGGPLLSTVDRTVKASTLGQTMKRLEPQGNDKVQIWFENTGFDALLTWLGTLAAQDQIHINSINIERQEQPGQVNARVVLIKGN